MHEIGKNTYYSDRNYAHITQTLTYLHQHECELTQSQRRQRDIVICSQALKG